MCPRACWKTTATCPASVQGMRAVRVKQKSEAASKLLWALKRLIQWPHVVSDVANLAISSNCHSVNKCSGGWSGGASPSAKYWLIHSLNFSTRSRKVTRLLHSMSLSNCLIAFNKNARVVRTSVKAMTFRSMQHSFVSSSNIFAGDSAAIIEQSHNQWNGWKNLAFLKK